MEVEMKSTKSPVSKAPAKTSETKPAERTSAVETWRPLDNLRKEVDRLFETFDQGIWRFPFPRAADFMQPSWRTDVAWTVDPAVDIVEKDNAYELTAELSGLDEKDIDVNVANGRLTIKGEKEEDKEERKKNYYLRERRFGSFERSFAIPEGVDASKIDASFKKGVLTVTLPKTQEAKKPAKKIAVKGS
jgi:HSP20 family protein